MNNTLKPIVIITGPSGVGKGTIEKILFEYKELHLRLSCSATTRKPREGEIDGIHYFFVSKEKFKKHIENDELLEYSFHFDNYYGTLFSEINKIHTEGDVPVLEIETNGTKQILEKLKSSDQYRVISIFVTPPTVDDLELRIKKRNTETKKSLIKRLEKAKEELSNTNLFQYVIINDIPERAAKEIRDKLLEEMDKK
ncbi:guanylate kinase [Mycoplasma sp. Mirounga ES2805-ORL]|uniref:guanylate kinase n=1 Tax=Mycoplasma sp. Mirounga ES2805-ORL TaxID=754514 RepID=UPI00197B3F9D|nr:guanylate kinase [Mycoplasma sp. Mirounga ES2805-ORL]QSF13441.1 guanylate kinase [Mycoplasma sp. Mirounga ES2805-ORL]